MRIKTTICIDFHTKKLFFIDWRRAPSAPESVRMTKENRSNNLRGQVYDSLKRETEDFELW